MKSIAALLIAITVALTRSKVKVIVFFLVSYIAIGCTIREQTHIGRFVFIDDREICHVIKDCPKLLNGKDNLGHSIYAMQPCDTAEFMFGSLDRVCSNCVSVADFEHLKTISDQHKSAKYDAFRKLMYNNLKEEGYNMLPFEVFVEELSVESGRRVLYKEALSKGWTNYFFEDFSRELGF